MTLYKFREGLIQDSGDTGEEFLQFTVLFVILKLLVVAGALTKKN